MPHLSLPHPACHLEASPCPDPLGPHLLNGRSVAGSQKLRKEGAWGVPRLEPFVCWLLPPTPGPQQKSKLVRSHLAVGGDV